MSFYKRDYTREYMLLHTLLVLLNQEACDQAPISQTVLFSQLIYEHCIITIIITLQLCTPTVLFFSILLCNIHFPCVHISADFKYSMLLYMQIALLSYRSVALCLPWLEAPSLQCQPTEQIPLWIMQLKDHHHRWVSLLYTK